MAGFASYYGVCYADQASLWQAIVSGSLSSYPVPPYKYDSLVIEPWPLAGPNFGKPYYHVEGHQGTNPTSTLQGFYVNPCDVPSPVVLVPSSATLSLMNGGTWPASAPPSSGSVFPASHKTALGSGFGNITDTYGDLIGSLYPYDLILVGLLLAPFVLHRMFKIFSK